MIEHLHPPKLDIKQAAQATDPVAGQDLLLNYERLMDETQGAGAKNALHWSALVQLDTGHAGPDQIELQLQIQTVLPLICQRCLGPVEVPVRVDRTFRFVENEALAAALDEASEEDLLVLSREFDLAGLIEDEVLMALPLVPRHQVCPAPVKLAAVDDGFAAASVKPNPFAALARLKDQNADGCDSK